MSKVTLIMPTYNCASFIRAALDSVFNQTRPPDEVIVVDDRSTDNTSEILLSYGDRIICITSLDSGGYASAVRNVGLAAATGDYIAFLDADDVWFPNKLAEQIAVLDANPDVQMVYANFNRTDENDNVIHPAPNRPHAIENGRIVETDEYWEDAFCQLAVRCFMHTSTVVLRKSVLDIVGAFDSSILYYEDAELWMRITHSHRVMRVPKIFASYRARSGSATKWRRELFVRDSKVLYKKALKLVADEPERRRFVRYAGRLVVASALVTTAYAPIELSKWKRIGMLCQALWLDPKLWVNEPHVWKNAMKLLLCFSIRDIVNGKSCQK